MSESNESYLPQARLCYQLYHCYQYLCLLSVHCVRLLLLLLLLLTV